MRASCSSSRSSRGWVGWTVCVGCARGGTLHGKVTGDIVIHGGSGREEEDTLFGSNATSHWTNVNGSFICF
ncbi:hypothetical protein C8R46DRAFT_1056065 [Mycena filopes]|nr:hypothetical protein C8R46DRAFT_1056065 [Mycena filopes]